MHKIFFWCSIILLLSAWNTFLCYINFFFLYMKHFFVQHQHVFVNTKILFVQRQTFCFNTKLFFTKFLFWASFRMLCYGDIFLLSQQKYITCQKISYLCDTKKLISFFFFFASQFFCIHLLHYSLSACWSSPWWSWKQKNF